eukprot:scaffold111530_cov19-Tisochrysis_lutea.AAC.1
MRINGWGARAVHLGHLLTPIMSSFRGRQLRTAHLSSYSCRCLMTSSSLQSGLTAQNRLTLVKCLQVFDDKRQFAEWFDSMLEAEEGNDDDEMGGEENEEISTVEAALHLHIALCAFSLIEFHMDRNAWGSWGLRWKASPSLDAQSALLDHSSLSCHVCLQAKLMANEKKLVVVHRLHQILVPFMLRRQSVEARAVCAVTFKTKAGHECKGLEPLTWDLFLALLHHRCSNARTENIEARFLYVYYGDDSSRVCSFSAALPQVQDVEGKLPPKVPLVIKVPMTPYQSAVYSWVRVSSFACQQTPKPDKWAWVLLEVPSMHVQNYAIGMECKAMQLAWTVGK